MRLFIAAIVAGMAVCVAAIVWWALQLHRSARDLRDLGETELARSYIGSAWLVTGLVVVGFVVIVDLLFSVW